MPGTRMAPIDVRSYAHVVFFTGAGMSAESGVPTYRGSGGVWQQYRWQDYACQRAFEAEPDRVIAFHEERRTRVGACAPHAGHRHLAHLQAAHPGVCVITQNIDGLHDRAGCTGVLELHGSLWRVRCPRHGRSDDPAPGPYLRRDCPQCGARLRPDITWFEDALDAQTWTQAERQVSGCSLFVAVGTSGVVWPAAGLAQLAQRVGARMIEINPEETEMSALYGEQHRGPAAVLLQALFTAGVARG